MDVQVRIMSFNQPPPPSPSQQLPPTVHCLTLLSYFVRIRVISIKGLDTKDSLRDNVKFISQFLCKY